jgi:hypothetical protein
MNSDVFVDGVSGALIAGGVVRVQFFGLTPNGDQPPRRSDGVATLAFPAPALPGILRTLESLQRRLIQEGILPPAKEATPGDAAAPVASPAPSPAPAATPTTPDTTGGGGSGRPISPNFARP